MINKNGRLARLVKISQIPHTGTNTCSPLKSEQRCTCQYCSCPPLYLKEIRGAPVNTIPTFPSTQTKSGAPVCPTPSLISTQTRSEGHLSVPPFSPPHTTSERHLSVLFLLNQIRGTLLCPTLTLISTQTRSEGHLSVLCSPSTPPKPYQRGTCLSHTSPSLHPTEDSYSSTASTSFSCRGTSSFSCKGEEEKESAHICISES